LGPSGEAEMKGKLTSEDKAEESSILTFSAVSLSLW